MLNIAICLSGEPRYLFDDKYGIKSSIDNFRELCNINNIKLHIFYHFWNHITKRQRNYTTDEPVIETLPGEDILNYLPCTNYIIEDKKSLLPEVDLIWNYIQQLNEMKPRYDNKEILQNQIIFTNSPGYSQLSSLCKSQSLRLQYEHKNNIYYNLVIHTRTDVQFNCFNIKELIELLKRKSFDRSVYYPNLIVRNTTKNNNVEIVPEFCFSMGSSTSFSTKVFNNYVDKIYKDMFVLYENESTLSIKNDHTVYCNLLLNNIQLKLSPKLKFIKSKIHQMETFYSNEKKRKYSHY